MGGGGPTTAERPSDDGSRPLAVRVVASLTGPDVAADATFVDGIELGRRVVNRRGGVGGVPLEVTTADDQSEPDSTVRFIRQAVGDPATAAVLVVGDGPSVARARPAIEGARTPVVLLRGDLYSERGLFREVFQTSIPLRWQAAVLARYLVVDRGYDRVAFGTEIPETFGYRPESPAERAMREAMLEEGDHPWQSFGLEPDFGTGGARQDLRPADAVAYVGGARVLARLSRSLGGLDDPPQLAAWAEALQSSFAEANPPPGTVAPYAYTWAGWAEPIRRVAAFRELCRRVLGHPPAGFEQEGYDAVRVLADALERTRGRGGDPLVRALEGTEATYSSLPISLGPDDHLFLSDRQLGLFAVAGPREQVEPWAPAWAPWRPVMRTFTANGERTTVLDQDKRVFFPRWRSPHPAPDFWTSRYGITTRRGDPLH